MDNRFWDKGNTFPGSVLKEYMYWILEVSYKQHTLGSYILFCKRENVEKLSELTDKELVELKKVLQDIETALTLDATFKPIRFNYWQMGNTIHQLHLHGIPRYDSQRTFVGKTWEDKDCNAPVKWSDKIQTPEVVAALREEIKKFLPE